MDLLSGTFKDWHDFYMMVGTAAATLVGLTFVATSIGASFMTPEHESGVRAFLTPTVVNFCAILMTCLLILAPFDAPSPVGAALLAEGTVGIIYSVWVLRLMRRHTLYTPVWSDVVWYAMTPAVGYLVLAGAGSTLWIEHRSSLVVLAIATGLLLVTGIRNAWDLTVWLTLRSPVRRD
jgi:hypothetical protein